MCLIRYRALVQVRKTAVKVQPYLEGEATNCLTEHYIWRAIAESSNSISAKERQLTGSIFMGRKGGANCGVNCLGEWGRKTAKGGEERGRKKKGIDEKHSFRNRQVVGSTPTLGSTFLRGPAREHR